MFLQLLKNGLGQGHSDQISIQMSWSAGKILDNGMEHYKDVEIDY